MSYQDCIAAVRKAAPGLSDREITRLFEAFESQRQALLKAGESPTAAVRKAVEQLSAAAKKAALTESRNHLFFEAHRLGLNVAGNPYSPEEAARFRRERSGFWRNMKTLLTGPEAARAIEPTEAAAENAVRQISTARFVDSLNKTMSTEEAAAMLAEARARLAAVAPDHPIAASVELERAEKYARSWEAAAACVRSVGA